MRGIVTAGRARLAAALITLALCAPGADSGIGLGRAAAAPASVPARPAGDPESSEGPAGLKRQVRIVVETNAPPAAADATVSPPSEKSFAWKFSWQGWNGLHGEVSQKTLIEAPLAGLKTRLQGSNAWQVFQLEELKMSGKLGAKLALDAAGYVTGHEFQDFDGGVELRRARVYLKGDCLLVLPVSYELEVGYIPDQFYLENSYLAFPDIPWIGEVKLGQYQAPMALDAVTSSRDGTFMEAAAPVQALAPGVNAGLQIGRPVLGQRATWRLGFFTDGVSGDFGDASQDYGRAILRLSGLPLWQPDPDAPRNARLLHVGLSANVLYSGSRSVQYRSRPESHLAPYVVDTGSLAADGALVVGAEVAWVHGPFCLQGELLHSWVRENDGQVPHFPGLYASASWFLTGESRPYDRREGTFSRVIPRHDFDWGQGGWGAWELAARFSHVDLNSADVEGGRLSMFMVGVNWHLHSHVKWRFDYGFGHVSGRLPEGNLNVFQTRVEVDF